MIGQIVLVDDDPKPAGEAILSPASPGFAYAACVFEGICVYWDDKQKIPLVFRLAEHLERLHRSMSAVGFANPPSLDVLTARVLRAIALNGVDTDAHVRLLAFVDGETRIDEEGPIRTVILVQEARNRPSHRPGFHCHISSWRKPPDVSLPARVKSTANYATGRMATLEARRLGADAAIMLSDGGGVAEGATANIFLISNGALVTPRLCDGILEGITRDTISRLWEETSGAPAIEQYIDPDEFGKCDGAFFCGSLWEISPILSVNGVALDGSQDLVRHLKVLYAEEVHGRRPDRGWLTAAR
jgi:branched-chain amino acid aminotransferase